MTDDDRFAHIVSRLDAMDENIEDLKNWRVEIRVARAFESAQLANIVKGQKQIMWILGACAAAIGSELLPRVAAALVGG